MSQQQFSPVEDYEAIRPEHSAHSHQPFRVNNSSMGRGHILRTNPPPIGHDMPSLPSPDTLPDYQTEELEAYHSEHISHPQELAYEEVPPQRPHRMHIRENAQNRPAHPDRHTFEMLSSKVVQPPSMNTQSFSSSPQAYYAMPSFPPFSPPFISNDYMGPSHPAQYYHTGVHPDYMYEPSGYFQDHAPPLFGRFHALQEHRPSNFPNFEAPSSASPRPSPPDVPGELLKDPSPQEQSPKIVRPETHSVDQPSRRLDSNARTVPRSPNRSRMPSPVRASGFIPSTVPILPVSKTRKPHQTRKIRAHDSDESYSPDRDEAELEERRRRQSDIVYKPKAQKAFGQKKSPRLPANPEVILAENPPLSAGKLSRSKSSGFRGVTKHRRSGRQVYLGGYENEEHAAEAYDVAALKSKGMNVKTNFPIDRYKDLTCCMHNISMEELIMAVRRQSQGFSRGSSTFRGVTHHPSGRWEARIGIPGSKHIYLGLHDTENAAAKAYDCALVRLRGGTAATNFSLSEYRTELADYHKIQGEMLLTDKEFDVKVLGSQVEEWIKTGNKPVNKSLTSRLHSQGSLTRRKSRSPGKNGKNGGKKLSTSDATILALPDSREKLEEAPKDQENAESRKLSHKRKTPSQQDLQIHRNTDKHSPITETSSKTEEESPEPEKALRIKKSRPSGEKS